MSLYTLFKTNKEFEQDGIWIQYGVTDQRQPIRIKIARAGGANKNYLKALEIATRPYRKAIQTGALDNAMRLMKDGLPAWASEVVVTQAKRAIADQFAAGVNPPALNLPGQTFAAARAAMTVRTGGREIQYTLREWAESLGYEVVQ